MGIDISRFSQLRPNRDLSGVPRAASTSGGIDFRERSFLENPFTDPEISTSRTDVKVASNATHAASLRASGAAAITTAVSEIQLHRALGALQATPLLTSRALKASLAAGLILKSTTASSDG